MSNGKIGCFFAYSILMIILGMGLYKYRTEIQDCLVEKYHELISKSQDKVEEIKTNAIEAKY